MTDEALDERVLQPGHATAGELMRQLRQQVLGKDVLHGDERSCRRALDVGAGHVAERA